METKGAIQSNTRYRYLDWLRVISICFVFIFHVSRVFNDSKWHVKNNESIDAATIFVDIVAQWIMPLMFFISAIALVAFLQNKQISFRTFVSTKFKRLLIPFIIGAFTHVALQVYIERVSHSEFSGSFLEFYPQYFSGLYYFGGNFAWMGLHLWYLAMLFLFQILTAPFLKKVISIRRKMLPRHLWLYVIPIAIIEIILSLFPTTLGTNAFAGWSPITYLVFTILGYFFAIQEDGPQHAEKQRYIALGLGLTCTIFGYFIASNGYPENSILFLLLRSINVWAWIITAIGFAHKYLNGHTDRVNSYNEAVLPFYILHQTIIVIVAYFAVKLSFHPLIKFIILGTASFVIILILYKIIKRSNLLRFCFGMKTLQ